MGQFLTSTPPLIASPVTIRRRFAPGAPLRHRDVLAEVRLALLDWLDRHAL